MNQTLPVIRELDLHLQRAEDCKDGAFYASMAITCSGVKDCPYHEECPFVEGEDLSAPEGKKCPTEFLLARDLFTAYKEELSPDAENITILGMIKDLVQAEIVIQRSQKIMSRDGDLIEQVPVGITMDSSGNSHVVERPEVTKAMEAWERAVRLKQRTLVLLNATPKDRAASGLSTYKDPSTYAAELIARYEAIKRKQLEDQNTVEGEVVESAVTSNNS